jgi:hypothetical protein
MPDPQAELHLLNNFHREVAEKEGDAQASFLRNGFLPDSEGALIEAAIRCIPLVQGGYIAISEAAIGRLEAIVFKLRRNQETIESRKAVEQFDSIIQEHKKSGASDMKLGFAFIIGLAAAVGLLAVYIAYLFLR